MGRRRKRGKRKGLGALAVLLFVAVAYAAGYFSGSSSSEVEVAPAEQPRQVDYETRSAAGAESDGVAENAGSAESAGGVASPAKSGKRRAKGIEIPAYLTDRDEEIVMHEGFTLSYNKKHLVPNWVAWVLTAERTKGTLRRANNFQPDESIKNGPIALDSDYRGSGYDRGHMCPSADNKHSRDAMNQCFLFSNMCPQTHKLNAGDWEQLETLCRKWAVEYDSIYIVCGPIIEKDVVYETIGENKVTVPKQFYKVVLRWTGDDSAEAIGFIFNNDNSDRPIYTYAVTVDSVEERTGINFFSKLPKDVERKAEARFDCSQWKNLQK